MTSGGQVSSAGFDVEPVAFEDPLFALETGPEPQIENLVALEDPVIKTVSNFNDFAGDAYDAEMGVKGDRGSPEAVDCALSPPQEALCVSNEEGTYDYVVK